MERLGITKSQVRQVIGEYELIEADYEGSGLVRVARVVAGRRIEVIYRA